MIWFITRRTRYNEKWAEMFLGLRAWVCLKRYNQWTTREVLQLLKLFETASKIPRSCRRFQSHFSRGRNMERDIDPTFPITEAEVQITVISPKVMEIAPSKLCWIKLRRQHSKLYANERFRTFIGRKSKFLHSKRAIHVACYAIKMM